MKKLTYLPTLLMVLGLILMACQGPKTNPLEAPQSDRGEIISLAKGGPVFDMNDRFATETTGANGFGRVVIIQKNGRIEVDRVQAGGLFPDHAYELNATVDLTSVFTSASVMTNPSGQFKIKHFDLGAFAPGVYRIDLFITHTHPTVPGSGATGVFLTGLLGRDPLLACQPAPSVTVE